jgi:(1->4)-alpha-D-glucan 1-alpha-D-glucosylmutase
VVACFPVYRTYTAAAGEVQPRDRHYIEIAVARAKRRNPAVSTALFDFVRSVLLLEGLEQFSEEDRAEHLHFVQRFQQFTGPMMAKAVEDTAFYRYHRLISLNEVGGDPTSFGSSVEHFHRQNSHRRDTYPFCLLATSTHDTKRGEDVRARIHVLSEIPSAWRNRVFRWTRWNKRYKTIVDGDPAPTRNDEYLLYQTLLGTWPGDLTDSTVRREYQQRIERYMIKAVREAKTHSSWVAPDEAYERALQRFIGALLRERPTSAFLTDLAPFAQQIADAGMWNSLSQTVLKLTSPGVPDTYQGTEIWDLSLVDPDNRRPVDFDLRTRHLAWLDEQARLPDGRRKLAERLVASARDGRIKLYITAEVLRLRRKFPELMTVGDYVPLAAHGECAEQLCAFVRRTREAVVAMVAPRLTTALVPELGMPPLGATVWRDTHVVLPDDLAGGSWQDLFSGQIHGASPGVRTLHLDQVLERFPVALLKWDAPR